MFGPGGGEYVVADAQAHNGEIVSIGTHPGGIGSDCHPWTELDQTNYVHVHDTYNPEGHGHSKLVNVKPETHDVLVDYSKDGGSKNKEDWPLASVRFLTNLATGRWSIIKNIRGRSIQTSGNPMTEE